MNTFTKTLLILLLPLMGVLHGATIAYEGFDYSAGSLNSNNGGSGWDGAWKSGDWEASATGLSYGSLVTTGGSAVTTGNNSGDTHFRDLSTTAQGFVEDSDTFWLSFLIESRSEDGTPGSYGVSLYEGGSEKTMQGLIGQAGGGTSDLSTGYDGTSGNGWDSNVNTAQGPGGGSTTYLFVTEFDMVNGEATHYVNPTGLGGSSPTGSLATTTFTIPITEWNTDNIRLGQFNSSTDGSNYSIDEIRFGDDFASVTPIPEPGTLALMGIFLGAALMVTIKRRR